MRHDAGRQSPRRPARRRNVDERIVSVVPAVPEEVGPVRQAIAAFFAERGVSSNVVEDIQLVVSELATNAVMYGRGTTIEVTAELNEAIHVAVTNDGPTTAIPPVEQWRPPPPSARSGRGLGIVARLIDAAEVHHGDGRTTVEIRRQLPDAGADWQP